MATNFALESKEKNELNISFINENGVKFLEEGNEASFNIQDIEEQETFIENRKKTLVLYADLQRKFYPALEAADIEAVRNLIKGQEKTEFISLADLISPDERAKPSPLFYLVDLLNTANKAEFLPRRLQIFRFLLNLPSVKLQRRVDELEFGLALDEGNKIDLYKKRQSRDKFDDHFENNLLDYILKNHYSDETLRCRLLMEISNSNRSAEFQALIANQFPGNPFTLALEKSDLRSVKFLLSKGAAFEARRSYSKISLYVFLILFQQPLDAKLSADLTQCLIHAMTKPDHTKLKEAPTSSNVGDTYRKQFDSLKKVFLMNPASDNSAEILLYALQHNAIKNGHFVSFRMVLKAIGIEDVACSFFRSAEILALLASSISSDEVILEHIDFILSINRNDASFDVSSNVIMKPLRTLQDHADGKIIQEEQSCLHNLAANFKLKALAKLLERGANPNLVTKGDSLLHLACRKQHLPLVELLLSFKAEPNCLNAEGVTPIDLACENEAIRKRLIEAGAKDIVRAHFKFPEKPVATIEQLVLEEKLRREEAPQLTVQEKVRLTDDKGWVTHRMQVPKIPFSFLCIDESDIKQLKEENRECYHLVGIPKLHNIFQLLFFPELNREQAEKVRKLHNFIATCCEKIGKVDQVLDVLKPIKHLEIPDKTLAELRKQYPGHVYVTLKWFAEYVKVYIFENLTAVQQEVLENCNQQILQQEKAMTELWRKTMPFLQNASKKSYCFSDEDGCSTFNHKYFESSEKGISLFCPPYCGMAREFTAYEKHSEEDITKWNVRLKQVQPILARNSLGFSLQHRSMQPKHLDTYLKKHPKITITVGKQKCQLEFVDLTKADDYRFLVNTVITRPERLKELQSGDPLFFNLTPFVSTCLIDPTIRAFKGGHQHNPLKFPLLLAMEVPPGYGFHSPLNYTGPTDLGTPWKDIGTPDIKFEFLKKSTRIRTLTDMRQALYQTKGLNADPKKRTPDSPYPPLMVRTALEMDKNHFCQPIPGCNEAARDPGKLPLYTIEGLLKDTCRNPTENNAYSECVVLGNALNEPQAQIHGRLLLVERRFLDKFIATGYDGVSPEDEKGIEESLAILSTIEKDSGGRLKLALIDTNLEGYKEKYPVLTQLEMLETEKSLLKYKLNICAAREARCALRGENVPKHWGEEFAVAKAELKKLCERHEYLVALAKNPPRVVAMQAKAKAEAQMKAGGEAVCLILSEGPKGVVNSSQASQGVVNSPQASQAVVNIPQTLVYARLGV